MYTVKLLTGFSGARIEILQPLTGPAFVRKWCDPSRNIERLAAIENLGFRTPRILAVGQDYYDQEYIQSLDAATYLMQHSGSSLARALTDLLDCLAATSGDRADYSHVYRERLAFVDQESWRGQFPFSAEELRARLPVYLPSSDYYGDLTLENVLWDVRGGSWVWIDAARIEYDSWAFDLAKLRQDLTCRWFLRRRSQSVSSAVAGRVDQIQSLLRERYLDLWDDHLLILMLLRVVKYTLEGSMERTFLLEWIRRLWT